MRSQTNLGGGAKSYKILIANSTCISTVIRGIKKWSTDSFDGKYKITFVGLIAAQLTANSMEYINLIDESVILENNKFGSYDVQKVCEIVDSREIDMIFQWSSDSDFNIALHKALTNITNKKITVIGSSLQMLQILDDKISLTILAQSLDIPTIPWNGDDLSIDITSLETGSLALNHFEVPSDDYSMATVPSITEAISCSDYLGYPVTIKTSQHSGGYGVESVQDAEEVMNVFADLKQEFHNSPLFITKTITKSRLIKVDFLADRHNNVLILTFRDASVQFNYQSVAQETLSCENCPVSVNILSKFIDHTLRISTTLGYFRGLGSVEFLFSPETERYYFLKLTTPTECEYALLSAHLESDSAFNLSAVLLEIAQGTSLSVMKSIHARYAEDLVLNEEVVDFFSHVNRASRVLAVNSNTVSLMARLVEIIEDEEGDECSIGVDVEVDESTLSREQFIVQGDFSLTADYRPDHRSMAQSTESSHQHEGDDSNEERSPVMKDLRVMAEYVKDDEIDDINEDKIDPPVPFHLVSAEDRNSAINLMLKKLNVISNNLALSSLHSQQYRQSIGSGGDSEEEERSQSDHDCAIDGVLNILVSLDFTRNDPSDLHINWLEEKFLADRQDMHHYVDENIGGLKINAVAVADDNFLDHSSSGSDSDSNCESIAGSKMSETSTGSKKFNQWSSAALDEEDSAFVATYLETAVIIENYVDSRPTPPKAPKGPSAAATAVLKSPDFFYEMIQDRHFGQYAGFDADLVGLESSYNFNSGLTGTGKKRGGGGKNAGKHDTRSGYVLIDVDLTKKLHELTKRQKPSAHVGILKLSSNHIKYVDFPYDANDCMKIYFSEELVLQLDLQYLAELDLSSNAMTRFPGAAVFAHMPILNKLILCGNKLTEISDEALVQIAANRCLIYLDLSNNEIETLPIEIGLLTTLSTLKLSNNSLTELPVEITQLVLLFDTFNAATSFTITKNDLSNPPQECANKGGMRFIRTHFQVEHNNYQRMYHGKRAQTVHIDAAEVNYYDLIKKQAQNKENGSGKKHSHKHSHSHNKALQLKILILGSAGCGKTSLAQRLHDSAKHELSDSTSYDTPLAALHRDVSGAASRNRSASHSSNTTTVLGLQRDVSSASLSTTSSGGGSGKHKSGGLPKPLELPRLITSSSFNFTEASVDEEDESPFTHEVDTNAALSILKWHPKKKHLNAFLNHSLVPVYEATTPGSGGAPHTPSSGTKLSKRVIKEANVFEPKDDVKYLIHDFSTNHSSLLRMQEMLFSAQAIHVVAFDITFITGHMSVDHHIQCWIDLIQSRVPDAFILLVATHCDLLTPPEADAKIAICDKRLQINKDIHAADAARDRLYASNVEAAFIKHQGGSEKAQEAARAKAEIVIPDVSQVDYSIMRVACPETLLDSDEAGSSALIKGLACRIVQLSTATKDCPHPLNIIGKPIAAEWFRVKQCIDELKSRTSQRHFCSIQELYELVFPVGKSTAVTPNTGKKSHSSSNLAGLNSGGGASIPEVTHRRRQDNMTQLKTALSHWASVGEILWFADTSIPSHKRTKSNEFGAADGVDISADIVFLDPQWLLESIRGLADHKMMERVASRDVFSVTEDTATLKKQRDVHLMNISKGVLQWKDVRDYWVRGLGHSEEVLPVLRYLLEKYFMILRIEQPIVVPPPVSAPSVDQTSLQKSASTSNLTKQFSAFDAKTGGLSEKSRQSVVGSFDKLFALTDSKPTQPAKKTVSEMRIECDVNEGVASSTARSKSTTVPMSRPESDALNQFYLIPALMPAYCTANNEISVGCIGSSIVHAGFITLERVVSFTTSIPAGFLHRVAVEMTALQTQMQQKTSTQTKTPVRVGSSMYWDKAFLLEHESVKIFAHLKDGYSDVEKDTVCAVRSNERLNRTQSGIITPERSRASSQVLPLGGLHGPVIGPLKKLIDDPMTPGAVPSVAPVPVDTTVRGSTLLIRGYGHIFNNQEILRYLDTYCLAVECVLAGCANFALCSIHMHSVCPDCILNNQQTERGTFSYSELQAAQREYYFYEGYKSTMNSTSVETPGKKSKFDKDKPIEFTFPKPGEPFFVDESTRHTPSSMQLRKWNSKRHICQQLCHVKPDMLIYIPPMIRQQIVQMGKAEHEIHFLLDEVVRVYSNNDPALKQSVVKVMAVFAACKTFKTLKSQLLKKRLKPNLKLDRKITLIPIAISSGVVANIPSPIHCATRGHLGGPHVHVSNGYIYILTCEHLITSSSADPEGRELLFAPKFVKEGFETIFLVGGPLQWLFMAELVYQGSDLGKKDPKHDKTQWWDLCVLRIIAPIKPMDPVANSEPMKIEVIWEEKNDLTLQHQQHQRDDEDDESVFQHPSFPRDDCPLVPIEIAEQKVQVDQVVRLFGYPGNGELSVDWGRIVKDNVNGDIQIKLLSDCGSSGGPILDREGDLVGLLSRSYESVKNSCVQPLKNLHEILHDNGEEGVFEGVQQGGEGGNTFVWD